MGDSEFNEYYIMMIYDPNSTVSLVILYECVLLQLIELPKFIAEFSKRGFQGF